MFRRLFVISFQHGKILRPEGIVIAQSDEPFTTQGQYEQPLAIGIPIRLFLDSQGSNRSEPAIVSVFEEEVHKRLQVLDKEEKLQITRILAEPSSRTEGRDLIRADSRDL